MTFNDGEQGVSGKGNEEQRCVNVCSFRCFVDIHTYSHDSVGTGSSHATGDPNLDGSIGSQVAEISAEQAGHEMDERCSPPASHPEQDDAGLHSPAQSSQLSEEDSSQEALEMAIVLP